MSLTECLNMNVDMKVDTDAVVDIPCLCGASVLGGECHCYYRVADQPPVGWVCYDRQKPMIEYDPADPEVIFVLSLGLMGYISAEKDKEN